MPTTRKVIKWGFISLATLIVFLVAFGFWFMSLIPKPIISKAAMQQTQPADLPYIAHNIIPQRGRILAVVTSTETMGNSGKETGYELAELSRAYYVFQANGFEVDIASPLGGEAPMVIDSGDMHQYEFAFLNDPVVARKTSNTIAMKDVDPALYQGVFFIGGKGAMFDFPQNKHIQAIIKTHYESGKVVGAVCHGPAALVNVKLSNGQSLLSNKRVSSFTNAEELLLISDAREIFPFLLQEKLTENGANFDEGSLYLNHVSVDGNLVTGQNPWSTWEVAESFIRQMGYKPKTRPITAEENSVAILEVYHQQGYGAAREKIAEFCTENKQPIDRELLAIHSIMAGMQFKISDVAGIIRLLSYNNSYL